METVQTVRYIYPSINTHKKVKHCFPLVGSHAAAERMVSVQQGESTGGYFLSFIKRRRFSGAAAKHNVHFCVANCALTAPSTVHM